MNPILRFLIGADTSRLKSELTKGERAIGSLKSSMLKLGGVLAGVFSIIGLINFGKQLYEIGIKAQGIQAAFKKLNDPTLLANLRTATNNTVSDLNLMKAAVQANNFKIPLTQLGSLLQFANIRARETGESVDYLVESIVKGIARKSLPILDNLGLNTSLISQEFAKTGDMAEAVGNIIQVEMLSAIDATELAGTAVDQMRTQWENFKLTLSTKVIPALGEALTIFDKIADRHLRQPLYDFFSDVGDLFGMKGGDKKGGAKKEEKQTGTTKATAVIDEYNTLLAEGTISQRKYNEGLKGASTSAGRLILDYKSKREAATASEYIDLKKLIKYWVDYKDAIDAVIKSKEKLIKPKPTPTEPTPKTFGKATGMAGQFTNYADITGESGFVGAATTAIQEMNNAIGEMQPRIIDWNANWQKTIQTFREGVDAATKQELALTALAGVTQMFNAISAASAMDEADRAQAYKDAAHSIISAMIAEGVTSAILGALKKGAPLGPLAIPLAGLAGAAASMMFNAVIPKFAAGGIVPGGFPGDTYPAMLSSGETVIPKPKALGGAMGEVSVKGVVFGDNLLIVNRRSTRRYDRIRGY